MEFNNQEFEDQVESQDEQTVEEEVAVEEQVEVENETNEWKDRFLRLSAEFENFKKRTSAEQVQWIQRSQQRVIVDILSVVDDFDRALQQKNEENASLFAGIELIYKSFLTILKKYKVEEISTVGTFNPELHEAIMQVDSESHASDEIVDAVQKGFMMNGQVVRHAKVTVAK